MNKPPLPDRPVYPLGWRVVAKFALVVPVVVVLIAFVLQFEEWINLENFGLSEDYLLWGGLAVLAVDFTLLFLIWRCPRCQAYLGKSWSPPACCPRCGVEFS